MSATVAIPRRRLIATAVGVSAFGGYVVWNIWWLAHGAVPPSIFRALTGLPAPTTGGTRSFNALLRGDVGASLHYNPMTLPIVALLAITIALTIRRRGHAPAWVVQAWCAVLAVAWVVKLLSPMDTW